MSKQQRKAAASPASASPSASAGSTQEAAGAAGGGESQVAIAESGFVNEIPIPFLSEMQASFGDVSGVQAYSGPEAAAAAAALGTEAYAMGNKVAFASSSPPKDMVAHELAHAVQQGAGGGLVLEFGGSAAGFEDDANQAAASVMAGEPASVEKSSPTGVLKWGGEDHYTIGNLAGSKAQQLVPTPSMAEGTNDLRTGNSETDEISGPGGGTTTKVRTGDGTSISYGAMARFGGDYTKTPEGLRGQSHETLLGGDTYGSVDYAAYKAGKNPDKLKNFGEMALVASTNMNHFYPLNHMEWRSHHAAALAAAAAGDEVTAMLEEGHAGHFLMDCFASGHMVPRGYDSIDAIRGGDQDTVNNALARAVNGDIFGALGEAAGSLITPGIELAYGGFMKSGDWHDFFCNLPNGLPTTKGRFHGDHTMDGSDLDHVSGVAAKSLAEVMAALNGTSYSGGIESELPHPDFGGIMADPTAGPAWRLMMQDYSAAMQEADAEVTSDDVGETSSGVEFNSREAVDLMNQNVFGVGHEEDGRPRPVSQQRDDTRAALSGIEYYMDTGFGANMNMGLNDDLVDISGDERDRKYEDLVPLENQFGLFSGLKRTATAYYGAADAEGATADKALARQVMAKADEWLEEIEDLDSVFSNTVTRWMGVADEPEDVRRRIRAGIANLYGDFDTVAAAPQQSAGGGGGGGGGIGGFFSSIFG